MAFRALWMPGADEAFRADLKGLDSVTEAIEQGCEFVEAAMHVPDDVERPVILPPIRPKRLPLQLGCFSSLGGLHDVDMSEALFAEAPQALAELPGLIAGDVRAESPLARPVPLVAYRRVDVEYQCDRESVVLPRESHQMRAILAPNRSAVDDR